MFYRALFLFLVTGIAAGQTVSFIDQFGAAPPPWTSSSVKANGVATGTDGIYVVGQVYGQMPGQAYLGATDAFVRKYDFHGTEVWTRQFGTTSPADNDDATGILVYNGGVYVIGTTSGTFSGQVGGGARIPGDYPYPDVFLKKYDQSGNELWTRQLGSPYFDGVGGIAADPSGVYIAGSVTELPWNNGWFSDGFVRKFDFNGNEIWNRSIRSADPRVSSLVTSVASVGDGVYILAVQHWSTGEGRFSRGFLRKYDTNGDVSWTKESPLPSVSGLAAGSSHIYLRGTSPVAGATSPAQVLRQYDVTGKEIWTRFITDFWIGPWAADPSGVYLLGGYLNDLKQFVRKYDATGTLVFTKPLDVAISAPLSGMAIDPVGMYLVGYAAPWAGGPLPGQYMSGRDPDGFLAIIDDAVVPHPPDCAINISPRVSISRGGFRFNFVTQHYTETVLIKNLSALPIPGSISLVLDGLSPGAALVRPDGASTCGVLAGNPYVNVGTGTDNVLAPGETATAVLEFSYGGNQTIDYSPRVLAGSARR